jgi:FixJ family two-component response regulator
MQARTTVVAVVDDDPSMLRAADDLLGAHGFTTLKFSSADEFLEGGAAEKADCLLLDIHLDGMSGLELRQKLKASHPKLPVIFMTALADEAIRQQAIQAGCATFLQKPFPAHQLIQAINSVVPGHN